MAAEYEVKELYGGDVVIHFHPNSHRYYLVELDGEKLPRKQIITGVTGFTKLLDKSRALIPWAVRKCVDKVRELMGEDTAATFTYDDIVAMLNVGEVEHEAVKTSAASVGDYVHGFAEEYSKDQDAKQAYERVIAVLGEPVEHEKEKIDAGAVGLVDWLKKEKVKIESAERTIYSKKFGYTGTYDAIVTHKGKRYLVDYKTSSGIYNEHYYQTAAYLMAHEEETGEILDGVLIVAIVKEDKEDKSGNIVKFAGDIVPEFRPREEVLADFEGFVGLIALKGREKELQRQYYQKTKKT